MNQQIIIPNRTEQNRTEQNRLILLGIIDSEGYELDNRVYSAKGLCPTIKAGNARIKAFIQAYE